MSEDQINIRESKQSRASRGREEGWRGRNRRREKERGKKDRALYGSAPQASLFFIGRFTKIQI
jgi:hypothetical protein